MFNSAKVDTVAEPFENCCFLFFALSVRVNAKPKCKPLNAKPITEYIHAHIMHEKLTLIGLTNTYENIIVNEHSLLLSKNRSKNSAIQRIKYGDAGASSGRQREGHLHS